LAWGLYELNTFFLAFLKILSLYIWPRSGLYKLEQIKYVSVLVGISEKSFFNPFWRIAIERLKIFFNDFDKIINLISNFFFIDPGQHFILGVDDKNEVLRVILANHEVVNLRRKRFILIDQHN
jgi:hypothetical protein